MKKNHPLFYYWLIPISGGGLIWVYQIYYWLRYEEWNSFSLLWPLSFYERFQDWVSYPMDWVGFHRALSFIPFSIILIVVGVLIFVLEENQISKEEYETRRNKVLEENLE